jgi:hypothetical protein
VKRPSWKAVRAAALGSAGELFGVLFLGWEALILGVVFATEAVLSVPFAILDILLSDRAGRARRRRAGCLPRAGSLFVLGLVTLVFLGLGFTLILATWAERGPGRRFQTGESPFSHFPEPFLYAGPWIAVPLVLFVSGRILDLRRGIRDGRLAATPLERAAGRGLLRIGSVYLLAILGMGMVYLFESTRAFALVLIPLKIALEAHLADDPRAPDR